MLQRYLIFWLTLSSALAYAWPRWLPSGYDPFVASKAYLPVIIAATMFAIGGLLPRDEFTQVFRRWPTVLGGTAVQYVSMPLLAVGFSHLFGLRGDALLGVVMVGCVPGAMASNVLTLTARGNVSYSVSLTTSATLLSPLVVPLILYLALGRGGTSGAGGDLVSKSVDLFLTVVGPVIAGHSLTRTCDRCAAVMQRVGPAIANLAILWVIAVVVALNRDRLAHPPALVGAALAAINAGGFLAGWMGGSLMKLPAGMRRALTLEVGMQNAGLGTTLIVLWFPDRPAAAIPTALYTFGCMFTGTLLAHCWSRREIE